MIDSYCGCVYDISECETEEESKDCANVPGGSATTDDCGTCIGGNTGKTTQTWYQDEDNDTWGNSSNTKNCYNPGSGWVTRGGDVNDDCYDIANDATPICPPGCYEAKKTNEKMANTTLSNQHVQIQLSTATTNKEYGAEQNMSSFPPGTPTTFNSVPARTDNSTNSFSPNFTWNATDGYTIGVSHGHPSDGAPSPADLINAYANLSNPDLVAGGQAAIDYYKANFSITVTTRYETFVVTISDWTALGTLYNNHYANTNASNIAWSNEAIIYRNANPNASYAEYTAYAGLKLYGSAISISKGSTSATDFKPLKLDANNKLTTTPCPN